MHSTESWRDGNKDWAELLETGSEANGKAALASGLFLVLVQSQRLDFFCSKSELSHLAMDETSGTWGQSTVFALINLATIPHPLVHVYLKCISYLPQ